MTIEISEETYKLLAEECGHFSKHDPQTGIPLPDQPHDPNSFAEEMLSSLILLSRMGIQFMFDSALVPKGEVEILDVYMSIPSRTSSIRRARRGHR
jgi:hypothetical protein